MHILDILAIETSGSVAGAAVLSEGKLLAECYQDTGLTHSQVILPMVERVLDMAGMACADLHAIAVDVGPGSFTGVRIGVCLANGMADALNRPVVSVDSLEALAYDMPLFDGLVIPMIDARGDQVYAACFDTTEGYPKRVSKYFAGSIFDFVKRIPQSKQLMFVGDGVSRNRPFLMAQFPGVKFSGGGVNRPRASVIGALAGAQLDRMEWEEEEVDVNARAVPLYLRAPQAERLRAQKEQGNG